MFDIYSCDIRTGESEMQPVGCTPNSATKIKYLHQCRLITRTTTITTITNAHQYERINGVTLVSLLWIGVGQLPMLSP